MKTELVEGLGKLVAASNSRYLVQKYGHCAETEQREDS